MGKSKKASKAHWKRISHPDVEDYLELEREKEKYTFDDQSVGSLFRLDKGGPKEVSKESDELVDLSKLRCFQGQKPYTNVPDPIIKRNTVRVNAHVKVRKSHRTPKPKPQKDEPKDIWEESAPTNDDNEWLDGATVRQNKNIKKKPAIHQTTELKAIEPPHPGFSINPTFGDHQDLLKTALDIEKQAMRKEQKLLRATAVPSTAVSRDDMMKLEPYTVEEVKTEDESDDDDDKKPVFTVPKTKKMRRKARLEKVSQQSLTDKKKVRVMEADVYRIKQIRREIDEEVAKRQAKHQKKMNKKVDTDKFGQKMLSKWQFEPEKLNPLLSDELTGRLVEAKTSSNLLLDRFKSFQKRNILEVRVKQRMKRVNKLRKYQRPGDKMEWEKTGVWNGFKL